MIEAKDICKSFGGILAVDRCSLEVKKGSITGLIGPNGAGKTTLFHIIAGNMSCDSGNVLFDGEDITALKANQRFQKGLSRSFQIAQEFSHLSVLENLMVVPKGQKGESWFRACFVRQDLKNEEKHLYDRARLVLEQLRLDKVAMNLASDLSGGQKKLLELGRIMMADPKAVLLDEIGAGVNRALLGEIASEIERLNGEYGLTFFVIEHDMDLIARLCDPIIVMAEGKVLTKGSMAEIRGDERVIEAYLGRVASKVA